MFNEKMTILLAEHRDEVFARLASDLAATGLLVHRVCRGMEASRIYAQRAVDLVLISACAARRECLAAEQETPHDRPGSFHLDLHVPGVIRQRFDGQFRHGRRIDRVPWQPVAFERRNRRSPGTSAPSAVSCRGGHRAERAGLCPGVDWGPICTPPTPDDILPREFKGIFVMRRWVCTLLAICLLAANFPRAFCYCGAEAACGRGSVPACPRCCAHRQRPASGQGQTPGPCCCEKCRAIRAVPPGPAVDAPAPACRGYFHPLHWLAVAAGVPGAADHLPEAARCAGPPGSSEGQAARCPFLGPSADLILSGSPARQRGLVSLLRDGRCCAPARGHGACLLLSFVTAISLRCLMSWNWKKFKLIVQVIEVRLRFIVILAATGLLIGYWDTIANYWEKYTRPAAWRRANFRPTRSFSARCTPKSSATAWSPTAPCRSVPSAACRCRCGPRARPRNCRPA